MRRKKLRFRLVNNRYYYTPWLRFRRIVLKRITFAKTRRMRWQRRRRRQTHRGEGRKFTITSADGLNSPSELATSLSINLIYVFFFSSCRARVSLPPPSHRPQYSALLTTSLQTPTTVTRSLRPRAFSSLKVSGPIDRLNLRTITRVQCVSRDRWKRAEHICLVTRTRGWPNRGSSARGSPVNVFAKETVRTDVAV